MPEGPEIRIASMFINQVASTHTFGGKVLKGEKATKLVDVPFDAKEYSINAESRGKELKVHLTDLSTKRKKTTKNAVQHLLFRFGMSGCFKLTDNAENCIPKHAHLRFITKDGKKMLSFVDYRRFGKWEINGEWGKDRGPDPISNYEDFRSNILNNLEDVAFNGPICETMLNQKYFNGIGNYLRAEILYRCSVPPFDKARDVLSTLVSGNVEIKKEAMVQSSETLDMFDNQDILKLCNIIPNEVLGLPSGGKEYDTDANHDPVNENIFINWLRCYSKPGMNNIVDKNGRTIWFDGPAGKLKPKNAKSRSTKLTQKTKKVKQENIGIEDGCKSEDRKSNVILDVKKEKMDNQIETINNLNALPNIKSKMNCVSGVAPNPTIVESKDGIAKKPVKSKRAMRNAKPS